MKRIISTAATLILLLVLCASASALSISVSHVHFAGYDEAYFEVEGKSFTLKGNNYKTITTSEGKYTFYADGTYHQGTHEAKKRIKPIHVSYMSSDDVEETGTVTYLGKEYSRVQPDNSDDSWDEFQIATKDLTFKPKDDSEPTFGLIKCNKSAALRLKGNKDAKKFLDCKNDTFVLVYSVSDGYAHVNYLGFDGYVKESLVEIVDLNATDDAPGEAGETADLPEAG